jgi:hypothetical protein
MHHIAQPLESIHSNDLLAVSGGCHKGGCSSSSSSSSSSSAPIILQLPQMPAAQPPAPAPQAAPQGYPPPAPDYGPPQVSTSVSINGQPA